LHVERRRIDRTGVHGNELVPGAPGAAIGYKLNIGEREPPIVQKAEYELYNRGKGLDALVFTVVVQFLMGVDAVHVVLERDLLVHLFELRGNLVFVGLAHRMGSLGLEPPVDSRLVGHVARVLRAKNTVNRLSFVHVYSVSPDRMRQNESTGLNS